MAQGGEDGTRDRSHRPAVCRRAQPGRSRELRLAPPESRAAARVCAVFVTYHPDERFAQRLNRVMPQVGAAIIVDNGSSERSLARLRAAAADGGAALECNTDNLGVARALNQGMRHVLASGHAFALLLDQDTEVDADLVQELLRGRESHPEPARVAVIGARFRDTHGHGIEAIRLGSDGPLWQEVESVITSGSLLAAAAYSAVGPFREDFFIDHVDTEFCWRARRASYHILQTRQTYMAHTVGAPTAHRVLGSRMWTTHHSPDRRYYITRNDTVMLRDYHAAGNRPWRMKSLTRCLRTIKRIVFFEDDKVGKIAAVCRGWWDAVRGRMGPRR